MTRASILVLLVLATGFAASGCRTSQQARRSQSTQRNATAGTASVGSDSLVMVQQRLIEVIDSLSSLVQRDHARIRALEQQVAALRGQTGARVLPPMGGQSYPSQSVNSNPPPPTSYYTGPAEPPLPPQGYTTNPGNQPAAATPSNPAPNPRAAIQDRYAQALQLFNDNNFSAAIGAFQSLEADDPNSTYTGNYLYWEGESLYGLRRYSEALQKFTDVVNNYPQSQKLDDAMFKIGESYERMGVTTSARATYQRLLREYPTTEYRARAEARLQKLR